MIIDSRQNRLEVRIEPVLACIRTSPDAGVSVTAKKQAFEQSGRPRTRTLVESLPPRSNNIASPLAQTLELGSLPLARALLGDLLLNGLMGDTGDLRPKA